MRLPSRLCRASIGASQSKRRRRCLRKATRAIIDQLNRAVAAAFDVDTRAKLAESGIEVATSTPEALRRLISRDTKDSRGFGQSLGE
jgi:hypothetical protein